MRPVRTIIALVFAATAGMLTVAATPASASSTSTAVVVLASPTPVIAGHSVTLSGSVSPEGAATDCAELILYSEAFTVTNDPTMAPVYTTAKPSGAFSTTATIPRAKATGTYPIHLRCGGATVGGGKLVVQEAPSTLQVSPRSVTAGEVVTVSGFLSPAPAGWECASGVTLLSRAFVGTHEFADVPAIAAAVKADGTFTVTTRIPRSKAAGSYDITGRCGGGNIGALATLVVRAAPTATTTPAPAPPGPPVTHSQAPIPTAAPTPMAPGPVTQPATPAADSLAGRWVVPGLAAVGASTLAALGLWVGYRRRHLAGLSR
jgi:hypothetical protein